MSTIYILNMSFNFLLQATRVLNNNSYEENELDMIYSYVISVDEETLLQYFNNCTVLSYNNDLDLYIEIISALITIYEEMEEYEKCDLLLKRRYQCYNIMTTKTI